MNDVIVVPWHGRVASLHQQQHAGVIKGDIAIVTQRINTPHSPVDLVRTVATNDHIVAVSHVNDVVATDLWIDGGEIGHDA